MRTNWYFFIVFTLLALLFVAGCKKIGSSDTDNSNLTNKNIVEPNLSVANLSDYEMISISDKYLLDNYDLPNGSVGKLNLTEKQATRLFIQSDTFYLEFLLINSSRFEGSNLTEVCLYREKAFNDNFEECFKTNEEIVSGESTEDLCQNPGNLTKEECMARVGKYYPDELMNKKACPIDAKPDGLIGNLNPLTRCYEVAGVTEFLRTVGDRHRDYIHNVLLLDPYYTEEARMVNDFIKNVSEATWRIQPVNIVEIKYPISIHELGCNPSRITIYLNKAGEVLTSGTDSICVD
ncbi:MAG: hypothetical protein V1702_01040 [Candidatus Woesearchaeota archaeon]